MNATLPIQSNYWQLSIDTVNTVVTDVDALRQAVRILLTTEPGADVARPDFGIGLLGLIGQDMRLVKQILKRRGTPQFRDYLPEVQVIDYKVTAPADITLGRLEVSVVWRVKNSEFITTVTA